jgi:thiamine monophosphate synthase
VLGAGATRISVVRAIADAADPRDAAYRLRQMLDEVPLDHGAAHAA